MPASVARKGPALSEVDIMGWLLGGNLMYLAVIG